jgi:hypothetical protein
LRRGDDARLRLGPGFLRQSFVYQGFVEDRNGHEHGADRDACSPGADHRSIVPARVSHHQRLPNTKSGRHVAAPSCGRAKLRLARGKIEERG